MVITLQAERVLVDVDGKRLATFDPDGPSVPARRHWSEPKREPRRPRAGFIGLQNHDPGDVVYFREVSVRPLGSEAREAAGAETSAARNHLKVGIVQMALSNTVSDNRDRIVARIPEAAALGVRVVVFPEGALRGAGGDDQALVDDALTAIRGAARDSNVYVLFGGKTWSPTVKKDANWMRVVGPDGRELLHYEKLYDNHRAAMPGVFLIDGVPASAMICADRWLRGVEEVPIQQGAQISFELSNNFDCEWVEPFEWYWNVSRALRNNVWVLFANSCNAEDVESLPLQRCHGHSAIIAPDGRVTAATRDNSETIVVADLGLGQSNGAAARARAAHPALRPFWEAGVKLQRGEHVDAPKLTPLEFTDAEITIAAAQTSGVLSVMLSMIGKARAKNADLVAFPARAIDETALASLQAAAREHHITVVAGMDHRVEGGRRNSAFVIGPDGSLQTRYDQLSAASPYEAGTDPRSMWFSVKGVPAVVTIGEDALWTELAELAAVAGARLHVHLDDDADSRPEADLRRLQVWSNLASFHTFSATVNTVGSGIWDDLRDAEERRAAVRDLPRPQTGAALVYSPFSANLVVRAGTGPELLVATRSVGGVNPHYPTRTRFNPQMDAWYRIGAAIVRPQ
jgi:predicted amidohydrolase